MKNKYVVLEETGEQIEKERSFGRLAFERLISNLLSVKVWFFIIPMVLSVVFLWWAVDIISDTTVLLQQSMDNHAAMVEVSKAGMETIKSLFSSWLKFTGSLVVTISGIREIWKVSKIKEDTKRKKINKEK